MDTICGNQPLRWCPESCLLGFIPFSHPLLYLIPGLLCVIDRMWKERWHVTSEIRLWKTLWFPSWLLTFSQIISVGGQLLGHEQWNWGLLPATMWVSLEKRSSNCSGSLRMTSASENNLTATSRKILKIT